MFTWDFRAVRSLVFGRSIISIHRVFYEDEAKQKPKMIENLPVSILGETVKSMQEDIIRVLDAFHRPTIYIPEWNSGQETK